MLPWMGRSLRGMGEFELVRRLTSRLAAGPGMVVGPGDDAAVLQPGRRLVIATADLLVEGRHFDLRFSSPSDVGAKALTVNISDVAAMGGRPVWALVSLGAPAETDVDMVDGLYDGLLDAAAEHEVVIAGGEGWFYNPTTGEWLVNSTKTDDTGKAYNTY